jgi:diacylglycerol kinase family enzyme
VAKCIEIILNSRSGAQRAAETRFRLEKAFAKSDTPFNISVGEGEELVRLAHAKATSDCEILVAGGGDGTICTVGEVALQSGKTLGIIPLGTFNYFARNLSIPLDIEGAAQVILSGSPVRAAVLDLDGRLVLNNSSLGIHPEVLLKRRELYRRFGRSQLSAYLSVILSAFRSPPRLRVRLATREGEVVRETPAVLVCSNAYQMETFKLVGTDCLARGKFAVYVARMSGPATIFRLGLRTLLRKLRMQTDYEVFCVRDVTIDAIRHRHLRAAVDGELETLQSPMRFRIAPKELEVLAPSREGDSKSFLRDRN